MLTPQQITEQLNYLATIPIQPDPPSGISHFTPTTDQTEELLELKVLCEKMLLFLQGG